MKLGIVGYGNLGKASERIAVEREDMEVVGIFTRRNPETLSSPYGTPFYRQDDLASFVGKIDVLALCTGSANDLTALGLKSAELFNTVDSFDTHAKMKEYALGMKEVTEKNGNLSFIGIGWDPGMFSIMRCLFNGVLSQGDTQTFWGKGVSQGHSEAIRKIAGVKRGIQYTVPKEDALNKARAGQGGSLTTRDKHFRECFVVAEEGADKALIEKTIKEMPNYFADYDTVVHFISEDEFDRNHKAMPHGGFVLRSGEVNGKKQGLEFSLTLESNPDFTASVLMTYARACARMSQSGEIGVRTALDIPVSKLLDVEWIDVVGKLV